MKNGHESYVNFAEPKKKNRKRRGFQLTKLVRFIMFSACFKVFLPQQSKKYQKTMELITIKFFGCDTPFTFQEISWTNSIWTQIKRWKIKAHERLLFFLWKQEEMKFQRFSLWVKILHKNSYSYVAQARICTKWNEVCSALHIVLYMSCKARKQLVSSFTEFLWKFDILLYSTFR